MVSISYHNYSKCSKILYTKVSDKIAYAKSVDPDLLLKEQSDQGLHKQSDLDLC